MATQHQESDSLLDFLRAVKAQSERRALDPEREKEEWLGDLRHLLDRIRQFAQPYVDLNLMTVASDEQTVLEDQFGEYRAPALRLIGPDKREVSTLIRGRHVIGAMGRVDLTSGPKTMMLVRTSPGEWTLKSKLAPIGWEAAPLNEQTFKDALVYLLK